MLRRINERSAHRVWLEAALLLCGAALSPCFSTQSSAQEIEQIQRSFQDSNSPSAAGRVFRAGRDLIGERKWAAAAAKFNDFIQTYPRDKNVDAALYWLAFCLKQQGRPQEADQTLERLIKEYPRSEWNNDARALRIEIAKILGDMKTVQEVLDLHKKDIEKFRRSRERDDSNESLRLIALQSLFQADPERAMTIAVHFLSAGSKASPAIQEAALGLIARHGGEKALPALLDTARNQSIAESVREQAIYWIAQRGGEQSFDTLNGLYGVEKNPVIKDLILYWFAQSKELRARARIVEIARSDSSPELRDRAVYWIAQRKDEEAADALIRLYDEQKEEETKEQILNWLGQRGGKAELQKLLAVARNDSSQSLRERAVYYLGQSRDPEAIKLLEQILK